MNILITSAGRRGYIVEYFKKVVGNSGKVYVGNSSELSPAFAYADEYIVTPLIYSDEYIPFLLDFCKKHRIRILLSLFDIDLLVLAENKAEFEKIGTKVIVSDSEVVKICNDKWKTYELCKKNNIFTPKSYISLADVREALCNKEVQFPLIIKPRWGMGSIQIYSAENEDELYVLYKKCKNDLLNTYLKYESQVDLDKSVIVQETMNGQEYGVDIINDLKGNLSNIVIKKKFSLRSGETDCSQVVNNKDIEAVSKKISKLLKHIANLDVDLFLVGSKVYLLEMNARIGGGYPFSYLAGVDLPKAIVKWCNDEQITNELEIKKYGDIIHKDIQFVNLTKYLGVNNGSV